MEHSYISVGEMEPYECICIQLFQLTSTKQNGNWVAGIIRLAERKSLKIEELRAWMITSYYCTMKSGSWVYVYRQSLGCKTKYNYIHVYKSCEPIATLDKYGAPRDRLHSEQVTFTI